LKKREKEKHMVEEESIFPFLTMSKESKNVMEKRRLILEQGT
jgi:hypothetical protein